MKRQTLISANDWLGHPDYKEAVWPKLVGGIQDNAQYVAYSMALALVQDSINLKDAQRRIERARERLK